VSNDEPLARRAITNDEPLARRATVKVLRLTLVSHAMTDAMAAGRFPTDEPLNTIGRRQVGPAIDFGAREFTSMSGPEQRCLQTAKLLGLHAAVDSRLADLDCGRWRGEALGEVPPADLAVWLTDSSSAPHGGESVLDLIERVSAWLESLTANPSRTVAVTHPAVIRAAILLALDAPPKSFWRLDIAPASRTEMHYRGQAWTLGSL
jgi:broad specificity phosphatase PhoE